MQRIRTRTSRPPRSIGVWGVFGLAVLLVVAALVPARALRAAAPAGPLLVLIVASSTAFTDIPSDVVRSAYLGMHTEYRGVRLIPFNAPPQTPTRVRMDRALLGLEPTEVGPFWVDQRVRDGRMPPRTAPSPELLVRIVAQLAGAIGCVPETALEPRVRALRLDGKVPADSGYLSPK